jgi:hypothetical protein
MEKYKFDKWKMVIGITLLPVLVALFIADRIILTLLLHLDSPNFLKWTDNVQSVVMTIIRIGVIALIYGIIHVFNWLF